MECKPMISENPENPIPGDQPKEHADQESDKQPDSAAPQVPFGMAQPQTAEAPHHCDITRNRKRDWIDGATLILQIFALTVLVMYTIFTFELLRATNKSANAGVRTVKATQDAMKADQRAWVGLDSAPHVAVSSLDHGKLRATIGLVIRNFGKGPALKVMTDERIVTSNVDSNVQSSCNLVLPFVGIKPKGQVAFSGENIFKHQWGAIIFPNQPYFKGTNYESDSTDVIGKEAYVIGCIVYEDQFTEPHWTKFCYNTGDFAIDLVRDASSFNRLYVCNTNNYTDDVSDK